MKLRHPRSLLLVALAGCLVIGCGSRETAPSTGTSGSTGATSGAGGGAVTSGAGGGPVTTAPTFGDEHQGDYSLGPVAFHGSFNNSCAPYTPALEAAAGPYLAGVGLDFNGGGQLCDACILVTTRLGKTIVAQVITTGETKGPNDLDLSQAAYDAIYEADPQGTSEHPRPMKWQLAKCPVSGNVEYQFQTGANVYWSSLWVRNLRVPAAKVEVKSANHADWFELTRDNDGTLTDGGGFGEGSFTLRVTAIDAQQMTDTFPSFQPGDLLSGAAQLQ